MNRFIRYV